MEKLSPKELSLLPPQERLRVQCLFPDGEGGCWLFQGPTTTGGYGQFWFQGKNNRAHRVSYYLYNGPIPDGMLVRHSCHTPNCVAPHHLEAGTHADNMWDMTNAKRAASGHLNGNSRLSKQDVLAIVDMYKTGAYSKSELGRRFGVSKVTIANIVKGRQWSSLTGISPV